MTEFEYIVKQSAQQPNECSCSQCAGMCKQSPCLATPQDIERLIKHGYIHQLSFIDWACGLGYGMGIVEMIMVSKNEDGSCVLFKDGLCTVHEIKPTEGKLSSSHMEAPTKIDHWLPAIVAKTWTHKPNQQLVERLNKILLDYLNKKHNGKL